MTAKSPNSTISVRLDLETKSRLDLLSKGTQRSMSFLASQAVAEYVSREAAIIEGIEAGIKDLTAGRLISHDQAIDALDRHIEDRISAKKTGSEKDGHPSS